MTPIVLAYLVAIAVANLLAATYGPAVTPFVAFALVGFDLTARDRLHDAWRYDRLALRMAVLIAAGGLLSFVLNAGAGRIALASTIAFVAASVVDALVYRVLEHRRQLVRTNASNVAAATVDSALFVPLAFGELVPLVMVGQLVAKIAGGFVWSLVLRGRDYDEPEPWELEYQTGPDAEVEL